MCFYFKIIYVHYFNKLYILALRKCIQYIDNGWLKSVDRLLSLSVNPNLTEGGGGREAHFRFFFMENHPTLRCILFKIIQKYHHLKLWDIMLKCLHYNLSRKKLNYQRASQPPPLGKKIGWSDYN